MLKILLHSCCAPCTTFSSLDLVEREFTPTLFFYNPNIYPASEYEKRVAEMQRWAEMQNLRLILGEYNSAEWLELMRGLEQKPEGGARCQKCYALRLKKTAETARQEGIDLIATTLTISPLKKAEVINQIGETVCREKGIKYLPTDFKKKDGYKKSCQLANEYGFYRQNYCGCVFSMRK